MNKIFSLSLLLFFLLIFPTETFCQNFKGERRVYYLDATYSMLTNKVEGKTLWDASKDNLINAINKIEDPSTEIVVIAFADDKNISKNQWLRIEDIATNSGKKNLTNQIKNWKAHSPTSMTNLGKPINEFVEKEAKSDKINYMFLLTDGEHEVGTSPQIMIQKKWDKTTPLTFGFHVELIPTKSVALKSEINNHERIWTVQSAAVDLDLIRLENEVVLNIKNEDTVEIPIYFQGSNPDIVKNIVPSLKNSDFSIKNYKINDDKLILTLQSNKNLSSIPEENRIYILLNLPESQKTFLLTDKINVKIFNKKERSLTFSKNRIKGKANQYESFLWSKENNKPYEITIPLKFSQDAIADTSDSFVEFSFVDTDESPIDSNIINIIVNGEPYKGSFQIKPTDKELKLSFSFPKDAKTGKYKGMVKVKRHNLDRIGSSILTENPNPKVIEYTITNSHSLNPLAWIFIWIGAAILLFLILWFCLIKPIKYPRFRNFPKRILVKQNNKIIEQFNVNFKGARKVVFSNQPYKQSFLNKIFTGKVKSVIKPYLTNQLVFIPKGRKAASIFGAGYVANPTSIPRNGNSKITHMQNNLQITL